MAQNTPNNHERARLLGSSSTNNQNFNSIAPLPSPQIYQPSNAANAAAGPQGPTFSQAIYPIYNDTFSPDALRSADARARKRFTLALLLGFLVWLICGTFIGLAGGQGWWDGGGSAGRGRNGMGKWPGALDPVPLSDGNVTGCTDFLSSLPTSAIIIPPTEVGPITYPRLRADQLDTANIAGDHEGMDVLGGSSDSSPHTTLYKSKSYFHFDVSEQDGFYLLGRGRFSVGPVKYLLEEPKSKSFNATPGSKPVIEVEVAAVWNDKELLKSTKVCSLTRKRGQDSTINDNAGPLSKAAGMDYGVGIYSPRPDYPDQYRQLSFETVVRFPPSALAHFDNLGLEGPSFAPVDVALSPISFDSVHFDTANGAVTVPHRYSLAAEKMDIATSNGHVAGTFNVSRQLHLQSQNGRIEAKVNLIELNEHRSQSSLAVQPIDVSAVTSNGGVTLHYLEHPYGVVLSSEARTSNGNAEVSHQPAFEGSFELETSWGHGTVSSDDDKAKDPTGEKRKRVMHLSKDEHTIGSVKQAGSIVWQPRNAEMQGCTSVKTSLGAASLRFG